MNKDSKELMALDIQILSKSHPQPQNWNLKWQENLNKPLQCSKLSENELNILHKKRMLPDLNSHWYHAIHCLNLSKMKDDKTQRDLQIHWKFTGPSLSDLKRVFQEAKNLRSLTLEPECGLSSFREIRKARRLWDLSINVDTKLILVYPHLFKYFTCLHKIKLYFRWLKTNQEETRIIDKFFENILNLPKLQNLTVWLDEGVMRSWLCEDFTYYKTLLLKIHKAKLPSFEVVVCNLSQFPDLPKSGIDWVNYINTLYIGPICSPDRSTWLLVKKPEKRLRFNSPSWLNSQMGDLENGSVTIKNLTILGLFQKIKDSSVKEDVKNVLIFISLCPKLENLTLGLDANSDHSGSFIPNFNQKFSQIESLENLETFTLILDNRLRILPKISPPYGSKMKNLKILSLKILSCSLDLSYFAEGLKELENLEYFNFEYIEPQYSLFSIRGKLDCSFPFEQVQKLKSIVLSSNIQFSEKSIERLMESIGKMENLEFLKIKGEIVSEKNRKKFSKFIENLCVKKNLKIKNFSWRGN